MSENPQEQTEAKLLAFIEGELDEAGRADIARHLEANPKHRRLLDDLSAGRRLLRQLPREAAPVDLFEGFETRLERHVLLSEETPATNVNPETGNYRLNHRRWVRIRAAAAAVVLATGIGIIIAKSLPDRGSGPTVVKNTPTPLPAGTEPTDPEQLKDGKGDPDPLRDVAEKRKEALRKEALANSGRELKLEDGSAVREMAKSMTPRPDMQKKQGAWDGRLDAEQQMRMALAVERVKQIPAVRQLLDGGRAPMGPARAAPLSPSLAAIDATQPAAPAEQAPIQTAGHEAMFLFVASGDPEESRRQVSALLDERSLSFDSVDSLEQLRERGRRKSDAPDQDHAGGAPAPERQERYAAKAAAAAKPAGAIPPGAPAPLAPQAAGEDKRPHSRESLAEAAAPSAKSLSDAPTPVPPANRGVDRAPERFDREQEGLLVDRVLIVRGVPRSQAAKLIESLNRPGTRQWAGAYRAPSEPARTMLQANAAAAVPALPPAQKMARGERPETSPTAGELAGKDEKNSVFFAAEAQAPARGGAAPGAGVGRQPATAPANPTDPIVVEESLLLIYRRFGGTSQPFGREVNVTPKGTIFVVGVGEVPVAGLTPLQASDRLTQGMQKKDPKSGGAELRRLSRQEISAAQLNGLRVPKAGAPRAPAAPAAPPAPAVLSPAPTTNPAAVLGVEAPSDGLIDVVIVVQKLPELAEQVDRNAVGFGGSATSPATQPAIAQPSTFLTK
jgi:hypothetical protein